MTQQNSGIATKRKMSLKHTDLVPDVRQGISMVLAIPYDSGLFSGQQLAIHKQLMSH